jgi:hypothetical protein
MSKQSVPGTVLFPLGERKNYLDEQIRRRELEYLTLLEDYEIIEK